MQYKFEFMQDEYVPKEHLEWDMQRLKRIGWEEMAKMISEHYPYKIRKDANGKEIHTIELVVCSAKKFNEGMNRLSSAMALFPELKHIAKSIIEEMFYPEE